MDKELVLAKIKEQASRGRGYADGTKQDGVRIADACIAAALKAIE